MTGYLRPLLGWLFMLGGWALVLTGILGALITASIIDRRDFTGAVIAAIVSIFIFRGGIQILKIAVAARLTLQAYGEAERIKSQPLRPRHADSPTTEADW
jgi:uncharacterized protein YqgC (DUF456 family)